MSTAHHPNLPLPDVMLMQTEQGILFGHGPFRALAEAPRDGSTAFFRQDYSLREKKPWLVPEHVTFDDFPSAAETRPEIDWISPEADDFARIFSEVMAAIRLGTMEKCVPVVVEHGHLLAGNLVNIIEKFANLDNNQQAFGWWNEREGVLGATPESLFSLEGKKLNTMALAGTARRQEREVFCVDDKEIREHEFVAQNLISKLSDLGQVRRQDRQILDLGKLVHFQTLIDVDLHRPEKINGLVARLHPTPALGPLPRTPDTMRLATGWRDRLACPSIFGAPFGLLHKGVFRSLVAIRLISWKGNDVFLPSGCGVIEESRLVNEWRELRLKREAVKETLGI